MTTLINNPTKPPNNQQLIPCQLTNQWIRRIKLTDANHLIYSHILVKNCTSILKQDILLASNFSFLQLAQGLLKIFNGVDDMSVQQIPTILKSMQPQFDNKNAIKITNSQYSMMKEVIQEYCINHDSPRLYGILGRVSRRMKQANNPHLWATEYEYFANSMMESLRENECCRDDDTLSDINEIFQRANKTSEPGKNRFDDKNQILSIFG